MIIAGNDSKQKSETKQIFHGEKIRLFILATKEESSGARLIIVKR
jgi:hypothetical protein